MRELVAKFSGCRAMVVGDIILDEYLTGDCSRLSPEAPVPILNVNESRYVLGGAGNTAANIVALGGRVTLLGLIGRDQAGDRIARTAADLGVDLVALEDGRATSRKTRVVGQTQQLVRLDYEDVRPLDSAAATRLLHAFRERLASVDIVLVSDYAKGVLTEAGCQTMIREARRARVPILIDPRPQHARFYVDCDYITPNWRECLGLIGAHDQPPTETAIVKAGRQLAEQLHCHVVLTLGARGIAFFDRDGVGHLHLPTEAREVFDVSGAGDTVAATFAVARAVGASHEDALLMANRAAGIVVGKVGTATVHQSELLQQLSPLGRLVTRAELAPLAAHVRGTGKRIVSVNGSFDVLHAGHLHILREARRQADCLVVGVNSDASVRGYKGPGRPFIPAHQRAEMLLALRVVDFVHIFDEPDPIAFLEELRPDVHVNGAEYGETCVEAATVAAQGGRLHLVPRVDGLSTTDIIEKIAGSLQGAPPPAAR